MGAFEDVHRDRITGSLAMFDRMIFKGHLSALYKQDGARCFLWSQGVALKDFTDYAKATRTDRQQRPQAGHRRGTTGDLVRPCEDPQPRATQRRAGRSQIAERDGISEGIVCLIIGGRVVLQLPGPQAQRDRPPRVVPPGTQVPAPLPVSHRPRVRVHARAHAGLDPLRVPDLHQRPGVAGPAVGPAGSAMSATTTRCWPSTISTPPPSCATGSPTRPGPGCSTRSPGG